MKKDLTFVKISCICRAIKLLVSVSLDKHRPAQTGYNFTPMDAPIGKYTREILKDPKSTKQLFELLRLRESSVVIEVLGKKIRFRRAGQAEVDLNTAR
ncbi:MAG: hypothetical protein RJA20_1873 [Bacteroidota bacterium]